MRVAVYNRHWSTGGGGERYGGAIAEVLARRHEVDLLTHEAVDFDWLEERLGLDLSSTRVRLLGAAPGGVAMASQDYDLFVNVSYLSGDVNQATRGLYVVHFPGRLNGAGRGLRWPTRLVSSRRSDRSHVRVTLGHGFHAREGGRPGVNWTNGDASLYVMAPPGEADSIELVFAHMRPPSVGSTAVQIMVEQELVREMTVQAGSRVTGRARTSVVVPLNGRGNGPLELRILSDTFCPGEVTDSDDSRSLGLPLSEVRIRARDGRRGDAVMRRVPTASPTAFLSSYDAIVANSAFTSDWVARRWGVRSDVLHPPARHCNPGPKEPIILTVGRFFGAEHGHSKKQLEMVQAFRRLCERGLSGWTLHLAGGCKQQDRDYLHHVRQSADRLQVEFHVDITGADLEALFARSSIYWHATGLGENATRHPERLEHFGISAVEAMSAGAVPLVLNRGGPIEVVRHGLDGLHFGSVRELVERTEQLIGDDILRSRLSAGAVNRAQSLSGRQFSERLTAIVDRLFSSPPTVPPA